MKVIRTTDLFSALHRPSECSMHEADSMYKTNANTGMPDILDVGKINLFALHQKEKASTNMPVQISTTETPAQSI